MKKIILFTILLILLPTATILILTKKSTQNINDFTFEKNTLVRIKRTEKDAIETIPLETYLIGVLAGEMPSSYDLEALKAQAVAARTYTLKKLTTNQNNEYDLVDTTNDQVYLDPEYLKQTWKENYNQNINKIKQAIKETTGEYITYDGEIIKAFFFSTSSGNTENCKDVFGENLPYLVSVSSTWDQNSPSYEKSETFTKEEFYNKLNLEYQDNLNIEITRNPTNSINTITINNQTIKGTDFRHKLNLRSTNVEIEEIDNQIKITSKGYGHGVGMSQYGALELAKIGYTYQEILKYYYQGTELKKI